MIVEVKNISSKISASSTHLVRALGFLVISLFSIQTGNAKSQVTESQSITKFISEQSVFTLKEAESLVFDTIAQENMKTLTQMSSDVKASESMESKGHKKWHEVLVDTLDDHLHLDPKEKRRLTFMLFAQYEKRHPFAPNTVLDKTSWQDLELLCGPKSDVSHYLGAKIDETVTEAGKAIFFKKLIEPTCHPEILLSNQKIIRELYENEKIFQEFEEELARFKEAENIILSLWHEDIFFDALKQDELNIPYAPNASKYINKTPGIVEMNAYTKLASSLTANGVMFVTAFALPIAGIAYFRGSDLFSKSTDIGERVENLRVSAKISFFGLIFAGIKMYSAATSEPTIDGVENFIVGPFTGYPSLFFPDYLRYVFAFRHCLQTKLIYTAQYVDALKKIAQKTRECPILKLYCPTIANLEDELNELGKESEDMEQLLALLQTSTFQGKASFFSWYGRSNVAYQLLHKVKNKFVHPMMVVGELDAYLSCVRLIKKLESKNIPVCFPQYICAQEPALSITNFWNPCLPAHKAVANSLMIGYANPKNIIVTGPNAGGKSTTMKGLLINIIMAQTFGIATAESFTLTPFAKIITYLNITDDIAAGKSHFKAGACRARELIQTAQSQTGSNFTLTAVDEVFNGTTFYEGQAAAYALIEQLSSFSNNMCVTITHFPKVPSLEQEHPGLFANYKVTACFDENNNMTYPYKLDRGISHQNIAFEILKREGFNDTFLTKATDILAENNGQKDAQ